MYIYLGSDSVVRSEDIIGVFDIENTSVGKITREYLSAAGKRKSDVYVSFDMPKSFILTEKDGRERVFISPISPATIIKRTKKISN